jgi:hypothetical protein
VTFDMRDRTRRVVAGVLALAFLGAGVGGAVSAVTASTQPATPNVAPAKAGTQAPIVPLAR